MDFAVVAQQIVGAVSSGCGVISVAITFLVWFAGIGWGESSASTALPVPPPAQAPARGNKSAYRVLLPYSESRLTPSVVNVDQAVRSTLGARLPGRVDFYTEFLDQGVSGAA